MTLPEGMSWADYYEARESLLAWFPSLVDIPVEDLHVFVLVAYDYTHDEIASTMSIHQTTITRRINGFKDRYNRIVRS